MAANEHKNLLDGNRHFPMGYEVADNNTVLGKANGINYSDKTGNLVWHYPLETFILIDEGVLTTGVGNDYIRIPYDFYVTKIRASLFTAGSGITSVDVLENGTSILSTSLTIDAGEKTSTTAATPVVISDYDLKNDNEITIDVTTSGGDRETARDLKVYLIGYRLIS